jgi:hypothetical protein
MASQTAQMADERPEDVPAVLEAEVMFPMRSMSICADRLPRMMVRTVIQL